MNASLLWIGFLVITVGSQAADDELPAIRVSVYEGQGAGPSALDLIRVLGEEGPSRLIVSRITPKAIQMGGLDQVDVLIQPGGSGGGQGRALEEAGRNAVRQFVERGGGYIGVCGGAYLATDDYSWSLGLIEAKVVDRTHWARGMGTVALTLAPAAKAFFGVEGESLDIFYGQGPLLSRREWDNPDAPDYESLAIYRTGIAEKGAPKGIMPGTSAIVRCTFGEGRVFVFSPHPELTEGLGFMLTRAVRWTAGRGGE